MRSADMDLKNNKITLGEILDNPKGEIVFGRYYPEVMNPFLLNVARKMSLENILKLGNGTESPNKVERVIALLKAI
jgi:hypothetical protein